MHFYKQLFSRKINLNQENQIKMFCYYVAGGLSGIAAFIVSYPLDTIKTQQQFRALRFSQAVQRIHKHRGWKGFYRGSLIPSLANTFLNTIFYGLGGDVKDYLVESRHHHAGLYWAFSSKLYHRPYHPHHKPSIFFDKHKSLDDVGPEEETNDATFPELFISGIISGFALLGIATPIELVKTKLQSQMKRKLFSGPWDCFTAIYKDSGVKGLYRGIVPMTIRNAACSGIRFYFVCWTLNLCEPDLFPINNNQFILAVGVAGLVSGVATLPFDAVKTIMQADDHRKPVFTGMTQAAKEIYRVDGLRGFYRGFWNVSGRVVPLQCLTFVVYDFVQQYVCPSTRHNHPER